MARPSPTSSTPVASGSRVPACPTRRCPKIRRQRATTSWEVQPASLSTTTRPVTASVPCRRHPFGVRRRVARRPLELVLADPAQDLLDPAAGHHRRIDVEGQLRRALHPDLAPERPLQLHPALAQRLGCIVGQRAQVHGGLAQVGGGVHRGDGDQAEALVGVGQPLELLGQHLAEHLVDPQRPRVGGGAPIVMPAT